MEGAFHVVLGRTMKDKSVVSDLNWRILNGGSAWESKTYGK